jgi:ABC-type amino acid transport substrate-binding protein
MSRRTRCAILALWVVAVAVPPSAGSAAEPADGIVLLIPQLLPTDRAEDGQLIGLWVGLPQLAAARAQVAILDIEIMPYARIFKAVPSGNNDCCPLIARTAESEKKYRWVAPTQRVALSAFVLKDRADPPRTIGDLKHETILALRGVLSAQALASLGLSAGEANTGENAVQMLRRGRASTVVLGNVAAWLAQRSGAELQEAVRLWEWPGYFACSPGLDPAISQRLADAINKIFAQGEDRAFAAADGLGHDYERMRPVAAETPPAAADH